MPVASTPRLEASQVQILKRGSGPLQVLPQQTLSKIFDNDWDLREPLGGQGLPGPDPRLSLVGAGYAAPFLRPWITEYAREEGRRGCPKREIPGLEAVITTIPAIARRPSRTTASSPSTSRASPGIPSPAALQAAADTIVDSLERNNLVGVGSISAINSFVFLKRLHSERPAAADSRGRANPVAAVLAAIKQPDPPAHGRRGRRTARSGPEGQRAERSTGGGGREGQGRFPRPPGGASRRWGGDQVRHQRGQGRPAQGRHRLRGRRRGGRARHLTRELDGFWAKNETIRKLHTVVMTPAFIVEEKITGTSEYDVELVFHAAANGVLEALAFVIGNPNPGPDLRRGRRARTFPAMLGSDLQMDTILAAIESALAVWHPRLPFGNFHIESKERRMGGRFSSRSDPTRPGGATIVPDTISLDCSMRSIAGRRPPSPAEPHPRGRAGEPGLCRWPGSVTTPVACSCAASSPDTERTTPGRDAGRPDRSSANQPVELAPGVELIITKKTGDETFASGTELGAKELTYSDDTIGRVKVRTMGISNATQDEAIRSALSTLRRVKVRIQTDRRPRGRASRGRLPCPE